MGTAVEEFVEHADRFAAITRTLPSWDAPSPCAGWTARDVLGHVIETQRDFLSRHEVDLGEAPDLTDPAAAWGRHHSAIHAALSDPAVADREFQGVFGSATIGETLARFYGFDLVVHRWDLAESVGQDERFTDAELDLLERSIEGFGEHLYDEGVCEAALEVGPDADRQARVLALLGRTAAAPVE